MSEIEVPDFSAYPHFDEFINKKNKFILDKDKNVIPATLMEWGQFLETDPEFRRVDRTEIDGLMISTVFLGNDHSFDGRLHIFETMIFNDDISLDYLERYSTWKEAEEGHQKAIQWVKDGCKPAECEDDE